MHFKKSVLVYLSLLNAFWKHSLLYFMWHFFHGNYFTLHMSYMYMTGLQWQTGDTGVFWNFSSLQGQTSMPVLEVDFECIKSYTYSSGTQQRKNTRKKKVFTYILYVCSLPERLLLQKIISISRRDLFFTWYVLVFDSIVF